jgi:endonuclease/exonuclease/phosphatase family metal-dependent hydrolase
MNSTSRFLAATSLLALLVAGGCSPVDKPEQQPATRSQSTIVGTIENNEIDEASGLARSQRSPEVTWVVNDDGPSVLHAIDSTGGMLGRVKIKDASNRDWEDMASFTLDGTPYLLVADIGDNDGKRKDVRFYVIEEPDPEEKKVDYAWRVDFSYPGGPRDAESVAVDVENERVLILSKREIPARLYSVPLRPENDKRQKATRLAVVGGLPQPSRRDVEFAPKTNNSYWQPTSMDISNDGSRAVILTYGGVFLFERTPGTEWPEALQRAPTIVSRTSNREAESITFNAAGDALLIALEQRNSPLFRLPLESPANAVTVMAFNVQNVFDNTDDPGKDDKAYLPIGAKQNAAHIAECNEIPVESWRNECLNLDWSDDAIDHKLSVIAATIRQVGAGRGPDIIAFQEVENVEILERLRNEYLAESGYLPAILIEGTDTRGIDVAFLSRLPLVDAPILHPLNLPAEFADRAGDTRGVLEATFVLPGGSLMTGFSVHFPAPFHPTEMRVIAYDHLNELLEGLPADRPAFAAGDFNTTSSEDARESMLDRFARPSWQLSNDSCEGCPGTAYYSRDNTWSFLDMILFSPGRGEKATWQIRADSVQIGNQIPAQNTAEGRPQRYDSASRTGVSDHWPVLMTIEPLRNQ